MRNFIAILTLLWSASVWGKVDCQAPLKSRVADSNLQQVQAAVAAKRSQKSILTLAARLGESERVAYASWLLKTPRLPAPLAAAVLGAHRVGAERGYYKYTRSDLRTKSTMLKNAGLTNAADRRRLMEFGAVGGVPVETEVSLNRYGKTIRLGTDREMQAYATFLIEAFGPGKDRRGLDELAGDVDTLLNAGLDREEALALVASFYFDESKYDSHAEKVASMWIGLHYMGKLEDWQMDALNYVLEAEDYKALDAKKFLDQMNLDRDFARFVEELINPPTVLGFSSRDIDGFVEALEILEGHSLRLGDRRERWALSYVLNLRRTGGRLFEPEAGFAENLLEYNGLSDRDSSAIVSLLKRDFKQELEDRKNKKENDEEDLEEIQDALELLMSILGFG